MNERLVMSSLCGRCSDHCWKVSHTNDLYPWCHPNKFTTDNDFNVEIMLFCTLNLDFNKIAINFRHSYCREVLSFCMCCSPFRHNNTAVQKAVVPWHLFAIEISSANHEHYLFCILLSGATLYIIPDSVIYDPVLLCQFLKKYAITRVLFTPSLFEAVLDAEGTQIEDALKTMRFAS